MRRNQLSLFFLGCILVLFGTGCEKKVASFTHPDHGYSFNYPLNWTARQGADGPISVMEFVPTSEEIHDGRLIVLSGHVGANVPPNFAEISAQQTIQHLRESSSDFAVLDSSIASFAGGVPTLRYTVTRKGESLGGAELDIQSRFYFLMKDEMLYTFNFTISRSEWEIFKPNIKTVMGSLALEPSE